MKTLETHLDGEDSDLSRAIARMLDAEIEKGEMPSAVWMVTRLDERVASGALGDAVVEPERIPASPDTIYDLASLTKPLVTTTLVLLASAEGRIDLDAPVRDIVPELSSSASYAEATWTDLLSHRAGFEAWYPLYVAGGDRRSYLETLLSRPAAYAPRSGLVYSDLGFVLLFMAIERVWDMELDVLARMKLFEPLGLGRCGFRPRDEWRMRTAATDTGNEKEREMVRSLGLSFEGWRGGVIRGEVNDGNAFHLGGVSGHAGLFGDASSVVRLASVYLPGCGFLPESSRRRALDCQAEAGGERRGLCWQLRTETNPGAPLSPSSFGHTGFTGVSVWIDPDDGLVVVLLTNRIHPRVRESRIQEIRRKVNEIVAAGYL